MKILHINTGQEGGAAWCALRINNSLIANGIESKILFAEGNILPKGIQGAIAQRDSYLWNKNWFTLKFRHILNRLPWIIDADKMQYDLNLAQERAGTHLYLHHPCSHYTNIAHHPLVEWADIIHLHWVADFIDYPSFFKNVNKPIVWTLHDMFPIMGLMHFESEFTVRPRGLDKIDTKFKCIKKQGLKYASNLHCIAISKMMREMIYSSELLGRYPLTLIHNGVDTNIYHPCVSRLSFGTKNLNVINSSTNVFLYSSYYIWDKRKGLDRVIEALTNISYKGIEVALIIVGLNGSINVPKSDNFPIINLGLIKDEEYLSKIYSSVDFFINASYEEAFAQTPLEAMACGTPVISTPCSGAVDLIQAFNGVICKGYDPEALAEGIGQALSKIYNRDEIRQYIIDNFDYSIIADKYIDLYKSILQEPRKN